MGGMNEGLRRESPEDPSKRFLRPEHRRNERGLGKRIRNVLGAAGALASVGATQLPASLTEVAAQPSISRGDRLDSVSEREKKIGTWVLDAQVRLKRPEVKAALDGKGKFPLSTVTSAIEMPIVDGKIRGVSIEGTKYDLSRLHQRFPVQVGNDRGSTTIIPAYKNVVGKAAYLTDNYGNGFYWKNRNTILTARHITMRREIGKSELEKGKSVDVDVIRVPDHLAATSDEQVVHPAEGLTNADIHGALVAVVGIDPDNTSDARGHKTILGIAARNTLGFQYAYNRKQGEVWLDHLVNSYTVIFPPGDNQQTSKGLSGANVFVLKNAKWEFAGVFFAAADAELGDQGRTVTFGQFHGVDDVDKGLEQRGRVAVR